jgi:hypothetical protein
MKAKASLSLLAVVLSAATVSAAPQKAPTLRRFALVVGSNRGFDDRPALRYAVRDAERFSRVLTAMGGVGPNDALLLKEPTQRAFTEALASISASAAEARKASARVEVLVYFSGHADDQGLMLGTERLGYTDLRAAIRAMPADVGIAVLDACASGAITRLKGGNAYPAFMSDPSMDVQGYAFLASSSEGEAAQESDRLGGSYFTNALLTGMRGAADVSGDGRVTLGEAYQFAFNETLAQTTTSQGGAQHASYDIKMAGTGDVVMTDVRKISASLILGAEYDGRFYILDSTQHLVAELSKAPGRAMEIGLEPGQYRVYFEQTQKLLSAPLKLTEGQRQELVRGGLKPAKRLPTMKRGGTVDPDLLFKRSRISVGIGGISVSDVGVSSSGVSVGQVSESGSLIHWFRPNLAAEFSVIDRETVVTDRSRVFVGTTRAALAGVRYYAPTDGRLRPFAMAGVGVFDDVGIQIGGAGKGPGFGGQAGFGVDVFLGRRFSLTGHFAFDAAAARESHMDIRFAAGWNFGGVKRR